MSWSTVPFGKYAGKTLPEIIARDLDLFFWVVPKLYGKLGKEARDLGRHVPSKFPSGTRRNWKSNISLRSTTGFAGLHSSKLTRGIPDGQSDFGTSTWLGRCVARNTINEQAVS
jgi:hypothetical protein